MSKSTTASPVSDTAPERAKDTEAATNVAADAQKQKEVGGRKGLDPTRYGDWEKGGIAVDF
ncbi:DUF1674 domain-containing protein [Pacificimonas pallii]|uniref:DUF1674 domain-containing protein n=1 Tax=Pacificimonas pallii TaxID=2827236 RepID=UPI0021069AEA|nr:DUF1674 domain-containing protein [Pacificimonas pallii]